MSLAFVYLIILENQKTKRIEKSYLEFQNLYNSYIDDKNKLDKNDLDKYSKNSLFSGSYLAEAYDNLKTNTFKKIEQQYLNTIYDYNLLKNGDTSLLSKEDSSNYSDIVKKSDELVAELKEEYNLDDLKNLKSNIEKLVIYQKKVFNVYKNVNNNYLDAKNNKDTTIKYKDDCFENQIFTDWRIDYDLSINYCNSLGLKNCSDDFIKKDGNYLSYTLNNPSKVNNNKFNYSYVSYSKLDFRNNLKLKETSNDKVYVEVFYKVINNIKIYKYNILVASNYTMSCNVPN
jgi:hypothetical protein